jgi:hypothetical protein
LGIAFIPCEEQERLGVDRERLLDGDFF